MPRVYWNDSIHADEIECSDDDDDDSSMDGFDSVDPSMRRSEEYKELQRTLTRLIIDDNPTLLQQTLSSQGVDINMRLLKSERYRIPSGATLLIAAIILNRPAIVDLLISLGYDVNARDGSDTRRSAVVHAAKNGHANILSTLINGGADINHKYFVRTPLFFALEEGNNVECVRILLAAHGIDTKKKYATNSTEISRRKTRQDSSLLMCAASNQHTTRETIKLLVNAGCDVNYKNKYTGDTALLLAVEFGSTEAVIALLDHGANANDQLDYTHDDNADETALTLALREGCSPEAIKALLKHGADVNLGGGKGYTPLMRAVKNYFMARDGKIQAKVKDISIVVKALLDAGSDIHAWDYSGRTVLHFASKSCATIVKILLNAGIDVNCRDGPNQTPLHIACYDRFIMEDIIATLIRHGADVNAVDKDGFTPIMRAVCDYEGEMMGCHEDERGRDSALRILLKAGGDVNLKNNRGMTALHLAVQQKSNASNTKVIQMLLDADGVDINCRDDWWRTPLMHAICREDANLDVIRLLIKGGCNVNARRDRGLSALHYAIRWNHIDIIRALLAVKDIDIDLRKCFEVAEWTVKHAGGSPEMQREVAAFVIQRQWRECYYNPSYLVCRKRLMEEGEAMERDVKRLKKRDDNNDENDDVTSE